MMKVVCVTVGSTSFDALSIAVLSDSFLLALRDSGVSRLILQHGRSGHPLPLVKPLPGLEVISFEYAPNLSSHFKAADLIISHAGAGSIIEALKGGKQLIVVANEQLMDNHQLELADKLSRDGYCLAATPSTLLETFRNIGNDKRMKTLVQSDGKALNKVVQEELAELDNAQQSSSCSVQ